MKPGDTFVLGASFSRAIQPTMPTLNDIGKAVSERLLSSPRYSAMLPARVIALLQRGQIPAGNVEAWLSTLAERQPFLSESDTSINYGLFLEISRQLVGMVSDPQQGFWDTAPSWLHRLVRLWHRARAIVTTLNYDTIVEESMFRLKVPELDDNIVNAILGYLPRSALPTMTGAAAVDTFRLIKLHGSIDWYWNPTDNTGDSLCKLPANAPIPEARAALAGKVPFIVPPLATKGPFYSLAIVRDLWQQAARAVTNADRVVVIGYSVPLTDLTITAMLSQTAPDRVDWHIVDPAADFVADRLCMLGIPMDHITPHASAETFVDFYESDLCHDMSSQVGAQLSNLKIADTAPIMIRSSRDDYSIVQAMSDQGDALTLDAHPLQPGWIIPANYPRGVELRDLCNQAQIPKPMFARFPIGSAKHAVLAALDPDFVRGSHAVLNWCPVEIQDQPSPQ